MRGSDSRARWSSSAIGVLVAIAARAVDGEGGPVGQRLDRHEVVVEGLRCAGSPHKDDADRATGRDQGSDEKRVDAGRAEELGSFGVYGHLLEQLVRGQVAQPRPPGIQAVPCGDAAGNVSIWSWSAQLAQHSFHPWGRYPPRLAQSQEAGVGEREHR